MIVFPSRDVVRTPVTPDVTMCYCLSRFKKPPPNPSCLPHTLLLSSTPANGSAALGLAGASAQADWLSEFCRSWLSLSFGFFITAHVYRDRTLVFSSSHLFRFAYLSCSFQSRCVSFSSFCLFVCVFKSCFYQSV